MTSTAVAAPGSETRPAGGAAEDVSVIICTYSLDRWSELQGAVNSVLNQRNQVREVVIVVDHSPALLARAQAWWACPRDPAKCAIRVVANERRRGLAGARNTGVAAASGEIVAFLDDDAAAMVDWIERLLAAYADPAVVACGGSVVPQFGAPRPSWWPLEFDWVVGCSYAGLPTQTAVVRNVIGANMSMRRSAVVAAGGFQEGIGRIGCRPLGCEETDLCIRLLDRSPGSRIIYEPEAGVRHTVPPNRLSWAYFRSRCFSEGLSKAAVAARVGRSRALATERSHATTTLPRAMVTALRRAFRGEPGAAARALAIVGGLALTVAGYVAGQLRACLPSWGSTRAEARDGRSRR